ncbi:MAG: hypothetical protein HWQ38_28455 [Nostoc sp. NMS7]|uniref:hypothetical protein n=1 Tax=Nostoc sp. NMS7 TaxID=2815391 RepID=UPI0025E23096|nr:hypothetical protein [Nostoc sp. NMS7]MBN3950187.1 hypothetical protein [Nostoc sp. NMS7]
MINYSDAGLRFIRVWILLAIAIGLIVPTITFVIWFKYPEIRKIFGLYLLVLIIQIVTEQIVSIWLPSLVVIIGQRLKMLLVAALPQVLRRSLKDEH